MGTYGKGEFKIRVRKLIFVGAQENNNKFYDMIEQDDGTFRAEWGRVGTKPNITIYPNSRWNSVYNEKIRKGYVDNTDLFVTRNDKIDFLEVSDRLVRELINTLQMYSSKTVSQNYNVSLDAVTEIQLNQAQAIIDTLVNILHSPIDEINQKAMELFKVIPRKMRNVQDNLLKGRGSKFTEKELEEARKWITKQQDILDSLKSQVVINSQQHDQTNKDKTLLDIMGLELKPADEVEKSLIQTLLNESSGFYKSAFRVTNKKTLERFNKYLETKENKLVKSLWHGSRNENWLSIMETGLLIRPSNAVYTGSMYGDGIYGATKARKSIGYTSLSGSYWARGSAKSAYLALFDFHIGKSLDVYEHNYTHSSLNYNKIQEQGCDSVFAHAGKSLLNDEIIVYKPEQVTIKYIVEIGS